jgi:hypothetical protein
MAYLEVLMENKTQYCQTEQSSTERSILVSTMACSLDKSFKAANISDKDQSDFLRSYLGASLFHFCNKSVGCDESPFGSKYCNLAEFLFKNDNQVREHLCKMIERSTKEDPEKCGSVEFKVWHQRCITLGKDSAYRFSWNLLSMASKDNNTLEYFDRDKAC